MSTTIWERVATALTSLAIPKAANVYIAATGAELPDQFVVYTLVSSVPEQHRDDAEDLRSYRMQISAYSRSGLATLPDIAALMTAAGFARGPIRELPYDEATRHFAVAYEFTYLEQE